MPIVATGMEGKAARDSKTMLIADSDMRIEKVSSNRIIAERKIFDPRLKNETLPTEKVTFNLRKFYRTNQDTCINQKPIVATGEFIRKGEVLADGCATEKGDLALGRNILVAFMPWHGYNFEDSIIITRLFLWQ